MGLGALQRGRTGPLQGCLQAVKAASTCCLFRLATGIPRAYMPGWIASVFKIRHFLSADWHHSSAPGDSDRITNLTPCADTNGLSFSGCRSSSWHRATLQPLPCFQGSTVPPFHRPTSASREKRTLGFGVRCARLGNSVENSVTTTHLSSRLLHLFRILVRFAGLSSPDEFAVSCRQRERERANRHLHPTAPWVAATNNLEAGRLANVTVSSPACTTRQPTHPPPFAAHPRVPSQSAFLLPRRLLSCDVSQCRFRQPSTTEPNPPQTRM